MLVIVICFVLLAFSIVYWTLRLGISPMPTGSKTKKCLLDALPSECTGKIVELGSGWGNLAWSLAKKYPHATVVGYEMSPIPYFVSKLCLHAPNLHFERRDFFDVSLEDATLVVCYLYPKAMQRLKDKFERELVAAAIVASHTFAIPGWDPTKTLRVDDMYKTFVYFYVKKP